MQFRFDQPFEKHGTQANQIRAHVVPNPIDWIEDRIADLGVLSVVALIALAFALGVVLS